MRAGRIVGGVLSASFSAVCAESSARVESLTGHSHPTQLEVGGQGQLELLGVSRYCLFGNCSVRFLVDHSVGIYSDLSLLQRHCRPEGASQAGMDVSEVLIQQQISPDTAFRLVVNKPVNLHRLLDCLQSRLRPFVQSEQHYRHLGQQFADLALNVDGRLGPGDNVVFAYSADTVKLFVEDQLVGQIESQVLHQAMLELYIARNPALKAQFSNSVDNCSYKN